MVSMTFQTNTSKAEPRAGARELLLDEHQECGCQCGETGRQQCRGRWDEARCECDCGTGAGRQQCGEGEWDEARCECRTGSAGIIRRHQPGTAPCPGPGMPMHGGGIRNRRELEMSQALCNERFL